jgi:hypothetical protein
VELPRLPLDLDTQKHQTSTTIPKMTENIKKDGRTPRYHSRSIEQPGDNCGASTTWPSPSTFLDTVISLEANVEYFPSGTEDDGYAGI